MNHSSTTINLGELDRANPLHCHHDHDDTTSVSFTDYPVQIWLNGTAAQWRAFANMITNIADELTRGDQFTDQDDFDQSRADHEVLL